MFFFWYVYCVSFFQCKTIRYVTRFRAKHALEFGLQSLSVVHSWKKVQGRASHRQALTRRRLQNDTLLAKINCIEFKIIVCSSLEFAFQINHPNILENCPFSHVFPFRYWGKRRFLVVIFHWMSNKQRTEIKHVRGKYWAGILRKCEAFISCCCFN